YAFYVQNHSDGFTIENNLFENNAAYAIQLYTDCHVSPAPCFHNVVIRNNVFRGHGYGISSDNGQPNHYSTMTVGLCDGCLIYNNLFYDNFAGIDVSRRSANVKVYNNTFYNNPANDAEATIQVRDDTTNTDIQNNISIQSGNALIGPAGGVGSTGSF